MSYPDEISSTYICRSRKLPICLQIYYLFYIFTLSGRLNAIIALPGDSGPDNLLYIAAAKQDTINTDSNMWKLYAFLSAFFAALTAIFAKVGVKDINSNLATAIRTTVILFITWGIVFFGSHLSEIKLVSRHTWLFLILSGMMTGLSWLFYFKAIQLGDVSRVAPIDKLSVVITIILAFIFLHEQVSLKVVIGGALIAAGSIMMIIK
jgi:transporter family protein